MSCPQRVKLHTETYVTVQTQIIVQHLIMATWHEKWPQKKKENVIMLILANKIIFPMLFLKFEPRPSSHSSTTGLKLRLMEEKKKKNSILT